MIKLEIDTKFSSLVCAQRKENEPLVVEKLCPVLLKFFSSKRGSFKVILNAA